MDTRELTQGQRLWAHQGLVTMEQLLCPVVFTSLYMHVVNIPRVTVSHSGTYTCQGWLTLAQGGETGQERSLNIIQKNLVVVYGESD